MKHCHVCGREVGRLGCPNQGHGAATTERELDVQAVTRLLERHGYVHIASGRAWSAPGNGWEWETFGVGGERGSAKTAREAAEAIIPPVGGER